MDSTTEEIKNRLDIKDLIESYLKLEKTGVNYRAICPFHNEKSPSFFISPSRQIFKCFGCGESGDIFNFVMKIEGVEFPEALKILANKAGVELKADFKKNTFRQKILDINQSAVKFFQKQLESQSGKRAKNYLLSRSISEDSIEEWEIGYAPNKWNALQGFLNNSGIKDEDIEKTGLVVKGNKGFYDRFRGRIIFPIWDINSQAIAFGGRIFEKITGEEGAKYLNIPNTEVYNKSMALYGIDKAKKEARQKDFFILVEGYTDAIMAHQAGYKNTAATCGTALTDFHLNLLARYTKNLKLCFDMDFAGENATKRGIDLALSKGFDLKIIRLGKGKDPADLIKEDKDLWDKFVNQAVSIMDFYFESSMEKYDKETLEGKKKISAIILPIIKKISNQIEQGYWIQRLSTELKIDEKYIYEELKKIKSSDFLNRKATETSEAKNEKITNQQVLENELLKILVIDLSLTKKIKDEILDKLSAFSKEIVKKLKNLYSQKKDLSNLDNLKPDFSDEEIEKIKTLSLEFELENQGLLNGTEVGNFEKELENILKATEILFLKERLKGMSEEIKISEGEGDRTKAENLLKKFNLLRNRIEELK